MTTPLRESKTTSASFGHVPLRIPLSFAVVVFSLWIGLCFTTDLFAQSNPVPKTPTGWKKSSEKGTRLRVAYTKKELGSPEYLVVKLYDRELLINESLGQWLQRRLVEGKAPLKGKWTGPIQNLNRRTRNMYTAEREFEVNGKKHSIQLLAVSVDKLNVRMAAIIMSQTPAAKKNLAQAQQLRASIFKLEIDAAKLAKRGLDIEKNPPKVKGLTTRQRIKPGLYVGTTIAKKDGKAETRYDLVLFGSGEYQFLNHKRKDSGAFVYSSTNGRIEIDDPFENDSYDWDEYCVYGKDRSGQMVVHAESKYRVTRLTWAKESDLLAPSEQKRQEEIAKREAERYKHVTKLDEGIRPDEIEKIIYTQDTNYRSGAIQLDTQGFLLLKDGRVHDGLPCAPGVWDLAASRSREPDAWGWWKPVKDDEQNRYTFAWPVRPREYRIPNGKQNVGIPFEKDTKLSGDFGTASTRVGIVSNFSSVRWWGIKLNKNGRFLKYKRGSVQSGGVPGMNTLFTSAWDDEGSVTSLSGPGVAGGFKRKFDNPALERMGKYEIDGYRLTLKFDSGRVENLLTFTDEDKRLVWFEGRTLYRKKDKTSKK